MDGLDRDPLFVALARPQMFAGVTFGFCIANAVIAAEFFLIFRSLWAVGLGLIVHLAGVILCLREPRIFELWLARVSHCPRVKNYKFWQCNSYRP
jgi:type IV secretion system protein VirB3